MRTPISQEEIAKHYNELLKLKDGFDLSPLHTIITDANANIIYANKAVEASTGFSAEEIIGKNPADLWGGKMPASFYEKMWHTIKTEKKPFAGEVKNVKKDGTVYWQELLISPILDDKGEIRFFIGIEPDITDKKKQEEFRDEFISALGHQTRNPLITTKWILEELLSGAAISESERQELEKVYKENQTLTNLVNDLLILSHIENLALQAETIELDKEISNIIGAVNKKYPNVSIAFNNELGSAVIIAIRSLALQVFSNIAYNASEHADKEKGEVTIGLKKFEQGMVFSCRNNGEPIPEAMRPHIFTKVSSTTGGAGLGLFIVKIICDYLGWRVSFDTGEMGTTFYVEMPFPNQ